MMIPIPEDGDETPNMIMPTPQEKVQTSKMIIRMPKEENETSKSREQLPKENVHTSKSREQMPKENVHTSKSREQMPKENVHTSKSREHMPKEGKYTSKSREQLQKEVKHHTAKSWVQMPKKVVQRPNKRKKTVAVSLVEIYRNISKFFQLSNSDPRDPLLNLHQFNYIISSDKCQNNVYLVTVVHSSSDKWLQRNQIRTTWGGFKGSKGKYFRTVFMLGKPKKQTIQEAIVQEAMKYNDIIQGDFEDTYRNLTYKHIMVHSWVTENCPHVSYILKVDDDIIVNVYNMVNYLNVSRRQTNSIYCNTLRNEGPHRHNHSKWRVSKSEYPFSKYSQFCEGFAYITTPDVAAKLVKVSRNTRFYWIDDVFVTGVLTLRANVSLTSMVGNHGHVDMSYRYIGPGVKNVMFIVVRYNITGRYWNRTWQAILKHSRT